MQTIEKLDNNCVKCILETIYHYIVLLLPIVSWVSLLIIHVIVLALFNHCNFFSCESQIRSIKDLLIHGFSKAEQYRLLLVKLQNQNLHIFMTLYVLAHCSLICDCYHIHVIVSRSLYVIAVTSRATSFCL